MATYGLTAEGFLPKSLEVIRAELEAAWKAAFGASIDTSEQSLDGMLLGILAEREALLWELAEAVYASQDPDAATDQALDAVCALTGTVRHPAAPSTVTLTLIGDDGTTITAGNQASTGSTDVAFETLADGTLVMLDLWVALTPYTEGDRVQNTVDGITRAFICSQTGVSGSGDGPQTDKLLADETDGSVLWQCMGRGEAAVDVEASSVETGPQAGERGDITTIDTPVAGWSAVINLADAVLGNDIETDAALRFRRELELAAEGESTADAIRAEILRVQGVTTVTVYVNDTDATDGDGVPPHAVEILVQGGDDQDIFDAVLASVAAGIYTHGTEVGTATDSEGTDHTVRFSRPAEITIYIDITVKYDADLYPADGDDQIAQAIVAFGSAQPIGRDAVATQLGSRAFTVAGVIDVPRSGSLGGTLIKTTAGPTSDATIVITNRQIATYDVARVTVHSSAGTP